jgi:hypothetical protein
MELQKISRDQLSAPDAAPEASNHWKQYFKTVYRRSLGGHIGISRWRH